MEAVKLLTISDRQLRRRFTVEGADEVEKCFSEGQDAAAILGHYCNWEWLSCVGIALKPERKCGLIYHPLRSQPSTYSSRDSVRRSRRVWWCPRRTSCAASSHSGAKAHAVFSATSPTRVPSGRTYICGSLSSIKRHTSVHRRRTDNAQDADAVFYIDMTRPAAAITPAASTSSHAPRRTSPNMR